MGLFLGRVVGHDVDGRESKHEDARRGQYAGGQDGVGGVGRRFGGQARQDWDARSDQHD